MKKSRLFLFAALISLAVLPALTNVCLTYAQSNQTPFKIGIVRLQQVVDGYSKHTAEKTRLEAELAKRQTEIDGLEASLKSQLDAFRVERESLSSDARAQKEMDLDRQRLALEAQIREAQADLDRQVRNLTSEILRDVTAAIDEIGDKENYHLILEADPETRTGVLFFTTTIDMTQKVIDHLNR